MGSVQRQVTLDLVDGQEGAVLLAIDLRLAGDAVTRAQDDHNREAVILPVLDERIGNGALNLIDQSLNVAR